MNPFPPLSVSFKNFGSLNYLFMDTTHFPSIYLLLFYSKITWVYILCLYFLISHLLLKSFQLSFFSHYSRETTFLKLFNDSRYQLSSLSSLILSTGGGLIWSSPYWNTFFTWLLGHHTHPPATSQTFLHYHSNPNLPPLRYLSSTFVVIRFCPPDYSLHKRWRDSWFDVLKSLDLFKIY